MYVPLISAPKLVRRKGGGGGRGGSHGGGSSSHGDSSSHGGGSSSHGKTSISTSSGTRSASTYNRGGGSVSTIRTGHPFAGRLQGGGTRDQVFGTRTYGSGYPGYSTRGVVGRPFPFYFWPIVWGPSADSVPYLDGDEYGTPSNSSRPGGPMQQATFISSSKNTTFHVIADNSTVIALIDTIHSNCTSTLSNSSSLWPFPYNDTDPTSPKPESAVQYYRASSVVLTLDGYNNTAALRDDNSTIPDVPLPLDIDMDLLTCLNQTIGLSVPLIDGADTRYGRAGSGLGFLALFWIIWTMLYVF